MAQPESPSQEGVEATAGTGTTLAVAGLTLDTGAALTLAGADPTPAALEGAARILAMVVPIREAVVPTLDMAVVHTLVVVALTPAGLTPAGLTPGVAALTLEVLTLVEVGPTPADMVTADIRVVRGLTEAGLMPVEITMDKLLSNENKCVRKVGMLLACFVYLILMSSQLIAPMS